MEAGMRAQPFGGTIIPIGFEEIWPGCAWAVKYNPIMPTKSRLYMQFENEDNFHKESLII
jgi:hypothetical protein